MRFASSYAYIAPDCTLLQLTHSQMSHCWKVPASHLTWTSLCNWLVPFPSGPDCSSSPTTQRIPHSTVWAVTCTCAYVVEPEEIDRSHQSLRHKFQHARNIVNVQKGRVTFSPCFRLSWPAPMAVKSNSASYIQLFVLGICAAEMNARRHTALTHILRTDTIFSTIHAVSNTWLKCQ